MNALNSKGENETKRVGSATELSRLIEFEVFCGQAEGKSDRTIELTVLALRKLTGFLMREGLSTDARMIGADEIRAFILHLKGSKRFSNHPYAREQETVLSPHAINAYLRAIRAAWNRWTNECLVDSTPFLRVKLPRLPKKVMPTFSKEQLEAFFGAIDTSMPEGFRDYTLFHAYLDTAARLSEITGLDLNDIDLRGKCLKVTGKGNRERVVPFGAKVQKLIWKYLNLYRPQLSPGESDYVFITRYGRQLTKNRVEVRFKKYAVKAGITGMKASPHVLRHTACLLWVRNHGDLFSLQKVTGHSSLAVLRGYVNLSEADVRAAHERYSPVDHMETGDNGKRRVTRCRH